MYFTLPHLKEHFENMPTNKQDTRDELENTFSKNNTEVKQDESCYRESLDK
jgi:hypothetical protein